jgi:hypothetical protein
LEEASHCWNWQLEKHKKIQEKRTGKRMMGMFHPEPIDQDVLFSEMYCSISLITLTGSEIHLLTIHLANLSPLSILTAETMWQESLLLIFLPQQLQNTLYIYRIIIQHMYCTST